MGGHGRDFWNEANPMKTPKPSPDPSDSDPTEKVHPLDSPLKEHELVDLYDLLDYYSANEKNREGNWDFNRNPFDRFDLRPN